MTTEKKTPDNNIELGKKNWLTKVQSNQKYI